MRGADGFHVSSVVCAWSQAREGVECIGGGGGRYLCLLVHVIKRDIVVAGIADGAGSPVDGHIRAEHVVHSSVQHGQARGGLVQNDVVQTHHVVASCRKLDGDVLTGATIAGEVSRTFHILVDDRRDVGEHWSEGGHVGGVVHHTDYEIASGDTV